VLQAALKSAPRLIKQVVDLGLESRDFLFAHFCSDLRHLTECFQLVDISAHCPDAKPVLYWTPIIAPGNLTFYDGDMFPHWKGSALAGGKS
jgi:hypothetical protein